MARYELVDERRHGTELDSDPDGRRKRRRLFFDCAGPHLDTGMATLALLDSPGSAL
jgi:hypothetical protein